MLARSLVALLALVLLAIAGLYVLGSGWLGTPWGAGEATRTRVGDATLAARARAQREAAAALQVEAPRQILFGDLHVHTTYSADAFLMSLPLAGGDGAHPVADACDYARFCSGLDFWSINDHALTLTPRRWQETIDAVRQCNEVAGDPANPDVTAFLGWEWTQIGATRETHYGHKNVIFKHLEDERIPTRPITAAPAVGQDNAPPTLVLGLLPLVQRSAESLDLVRYLQDTTAVPVCPSGVPVREVPATCREVAQRPGELFAKLDDWGYDALVIPHGTTWGFYTPLGSSWDKQLSEAQHDPARQTLIEVFSGHGSSEEYRDFREVDLRGEEEVCPPPDADYLPSCWQAGEIVREGCLAAGLDEAACEERAVETRARFLAAGISGHLTVPGAKLEDWLDSGQCRDCFQPSFNYRPRSSVQYIMALGGAAGVEDGDPLRFRMGFIASSDNHTGRPGTGYKEIDRTNTTESRFDNLGRGLILGGVRVREAAPVVESVPLDRSQSRRSFFGLREAERQASFFLTGGLVAAHASGRDREAIWEALERKEVYGTSGPRILLWFDLVDGEGRAPDGRRSPPDGPRHLSHGRRHPSDGRRHPMGSAVELRGVPTFEVRAVGSFEQKPGCPADSLSALPADRLERLCGGECYHPSDARRRISRIEVVRIRPRIAPDEPMAELIEDPWRVIPCRPDPAGCSVSFSDPEFATAARDAIYYVRAIEEQSLAVNAGGLRCQLDGEGRCLETDACVGVPRDDDCLSPTEERAWSSPIFVDFARENEGS